MSRRKKKRRKRKKSKNKDSGLETEENMGMDELEGYGEAHEGYDQMTEINRFHVSSQPQYNNRFFACFSEAAEIVLRDSTHALKVIFCRKFKVIRKQI